MFRLTPVQASGLVANGLRSHHSLLTTRAAPTGAAMFPRAAPDTPSTRVSDPAPPSRGPTIGVEEGCCIATGRWATGVRRLQQHQLQHHNGSKISATTVTDALCIPTVAAPSGGSTPNPISPPDPPDPSPPNPTTMTSLMSYPTLMTP